MKFTGEVATSNSDPRPCYRVITQTLIAELNERDPSYQQSRLWELVDKLIEGAITDGDKEDTFKYLKYFSYY